MFQVLGKASVMVLATTLAFVGAAAAQVDYTQTGSQSQGQGNRPPPPPPMIKGFALGTTATDTTGSNVHLFMLDMGPPPPPPNGTSIGMMGVNSQDPAYAGIQSGYDPSSSYGQFGQQFVQSYGQASGANRPPPRGGRAMIAGTRYRFVDAATASGTAMAAPTPGQPPTISGYLVAVQQTATSVATSTYTTASTGTLADGSTVAGQLTGTFSQIDGQQVFTGTAQTAAGTFSLLAQMDRPGGPGRGGPGRGGPGDLPGGGPGGQGQQGNYAPSGFQGTTGYSSNVFPSAISY